MSEDPAQRDVRTTPTDADEVSNASEDVLQGYTNYTVSTIKSLSLLGGEAKHDCVGPLLTTTPRLNVHSLLLLRPPSFPFMYIA